MSLGGRPVSLVGEVVGLPRERVDGRNVRSHASRQQPGRHGEVLVVGRGKTLALGIRRAERDIRTVGTGRRGSGPEEARGYAEHDALL